MKPALQSAAAGLLALTLGALCLADSAPAQRQAVKLETLPPEEFQKLPGTATVQFQGRSLTKDQFLVEVRQKQGRSSPGPRPGADLVKDFEQKERARIAAKNARVRAASRSLSGIPAGKVVDACSSPRIDSVEGAPPLEPGQWVRINGCGFGIGMADGAASNGTVKLFGVFSGGSLTLNPVEKVRIGWGGPIFDVWDSHTLFVAVPYPSGVTDQNMVQLQVISASGQKSNLWQTSFRAAREAKFVQFSDLQVTCAHVGGIGTNSCVSEYTGARGRHQSPGLSFGTDRYAASLINGWEVDDIELNDVTLQVSSLPECIMGFAVKSGAQLGANARVDVEWLEYESRCPATYLLQLLAKGPKGIPYK